MAEAGKAMETIGTDYKIFLKNEGEGEGPKRE